jgi:hypothetical protein
MVEEDVNPVHQQYMDLSGRYKAGWTFHRFIQGLRKFFGSQDLEDHTADFQELYGGLRGVSKSLNDPDIQSVIARLEDLREQLEELMETLESEDRRVDPSLVRLFFQRVKTHDDRIILDLIRFYLEVQRLRPWESDRIDKVDYLLTRLAEAVLGSDLSGDRGRLTRVLEAVSTHQSWSVNIEPQKIANRQKMIYAVREEIQQLASFEELTERDLVGHYRHLKHGLGKLVFERSILPAIVDTNLVLAARIRELSRQEEKRILEDYEKVSRLAEEGTVNHELAESVNRLHMQVSQFRKQIGSGNLRLQDMTQIRRLVLDILEQAEESAGSEPVRFGRSSAQPDGFVIEEAIPSRQERYLLGRSLEELVASLLESKNSDGEERRLDARALSYRLVEREIQAFDRLASREECDEALERLVLASAALRHRINEEVNETHARRSDANGGDHPRSEVIDDILRLSDLYLRQFSHFLENDLLAGNIPAAHQLQVLRMRLMRDYSGLWLVAFG